MSEPEAPTAVPEGKRVAATPEAPTSKLAVGDRVSVPNTGRSMAAPMAATDMADAMREHGVEGGAVAAAPGIFGVGVQTYEPGR